MNCVELYPSLSHCIETVAREEYWNSVNRFMESEQENRELRQRIELLKAFLESTDFRKLRSASEKYLVEDREVKFIIYLKENKLYYEMKVI
jgi:hypothetical protein